MSWCNQNKNIVWLLQQGQVYIFCYLISWCFQHPVRSESFATLQVWEHLEASKLRVVLQVNLSDATNKNT